MDTPEGVRLELTLAGLSTRILATLVDAFAQGILLGAAVALMSTNSDFGILFLGGLSVAAALVVVGYPTVFETLNGGRTPGKAALGIRVVLANGDPVGFLAASMRNLFRLLDFLPIGYAVGAMAILASDTNQRLGDMAASTVVIRYRARHTNPSRTGKPGWDVSAITRDEVTLLKRFFDRSRSLPTDRRRQLAEQIATRLRPRVAGGDPEMNDEDFLRTVLVEKLNR